MNIRMKHLLWFCILPLITCGVITAADDREEQLAGWLKRFPQADKNGDGRLSESEARAFRSQLQGGRRQSGVPKTFSVDPGWKAGRFPDHAVCYRPPDEIAELYKNTAGGRGRIVAYRKPSDGSLRITGTGHSFMAPGYQTFPLIADAAGLKQPPLVTHTGGGITGSARYKWEQENGIFQFDRQPVPKLLASISNAEWDAMMWGPYYNDEPEYYICWIDFCLKYNPQMKFYLSDAWPQLDQLDQLPASESALTDKVIRQLGAEKHAASTKLIATLNEDYPDRVFVLPTSEAMMLATEYFHRGELPGVEGLHKHLGGKERSLWRDKLGHLGPGFGDLEGYVFYATIYGRSPELIESDIRPRRSNAFPGPELDRQFRKIAWQAALNNPLSGITDENTNGIDDSRE